MSITLRKLVVAGAIGFLYSAGSAFAADGATPPSGITPHPSALTKHPAPPVPKHGPHPIAAHGKTIHAAVAQHAAISCDHLAHHFVGTYAHAAFLTECHNTHHAVLTHVTPHPDSAKK